MPDRRPIPRPDGTHGRAGFTLEFETDHNSGQLRNGDGPYLFIAEVPANQKPEAQVVLKVPDEEAFRPEAIVDVVTPFEDTHWGQGR